MKIVTAIATAHEVEPLITAGADELYCGVVPEAFMSAPTRGRLNRRDEPAANIRDLDEFAAIASRAAARGVPVAVTLNEHAYAPATIPDLVELAGHLVAAGAHALIVTDVALILAIRRAGVPIDLHLSSVATCSNSEAAAFFADIGIERVILPRYLSTRQIARLCGAGAPVGYEVLVCNDGCGFEEGLCLNLHSPWGPMCQMDWRTEPIPDGPVSPGFAAEWEENWKAYRFLMGLLDRAGGTISRQGFPNGPCGVCALPALRAAGVGYLNVPGRGHPPGLRVGGLRLVRAVLNWVERGDPPELVAANARILRGTPLLCDSTYTCYFREVLEPGRTAAARDRALALADLAAAARFQRQPQDATPPAAPPSPASEKQRVRKAVPPAGDAGTEPEPSDPDIVRLRRIGKLLDDTGINLEWAGASLQIVFPDEAQPDGISCVILAKVDETVRCYSRSGNLGLWHSGSVMTPRLDRLIKGMIRLLELVPA